tara:strand:+ start:12751 stop:13797 length:1047 start_codon:yes stop_codon:yes gene_type:complete
MSRLFLLEKPSLAREFQKSVMEEGDVVIFLPTINGFKFKYPNLSYKNFPETFEPKYKVNILRGSLFHMNPRILKGNELKEIKEDNPLFALNEALEFGNKDKIYKGQEQLSDYMDNFEEIIVEVTCSYSKTRAFNLFFDYYLMHRKTISKVYFIRPVSLSENCIKKAMIEKESFSKLNMDQESYYNDYKNTYKNKDYFDYNFNLNSLLVLDELLKYSGCCNKNKILTHNMLRTLFEIKRYGSEGLSFLLTELDKKSIGRIHTRQAIIEELFDYGLIEQVENKIKGKKVILSEEGEYFLSKIDYNFEKIIDLKEFKEDVENLKHNDFIKKYEPCLKKYFKKQNNIVKKIN